MRILTIAIFFVITGCFTAPPPESHKVTWAKRLGFEFESNSLKLTKVFPFTFAAVTAPDDGGLKQGDSIIAVNGVMVSNPAEFERVCQDFATQQPQSWVITLKRQQKRIVASGQKSSFCNTYDLTGCGSLRQSDL